MQTKENRLNTLLVGDNPADFCLIEAMPWPAPTGMKHVYSASRISEVHSLLQIQDIDSVLPDLPLPDSFSIDPFQVYNYEQQVI